MKSKLFVLLAAILVATLVLGCAAPPPEAPPAPPPPAPAPEKPAPSPEKPAPSPEKPAPAPEEPAPDVRAQIIAQAKEEGELVVIGSHGEDMGLLKGFTDKYPFIEMKGMDMNTTKTVNRVVLEYKAARPSTDVVEVGDDGLSTLAALGALQKPEVPFPHMKDFDPRLQPASGLFVTVFASARAQGAYNSDMVPPDEVPTTWDMMTDPKWTGNTIISASGEDMPLTLASLWAEDGKLNWDRSFDFWGKLFQQEPIITKGYRRGNEQLASGERAFFWFTAIQPAVRMYLDEGAPVGIMAWPTLPTSFRPLGITKGAPHPAAAWLLIDYVMSPEGQFECTERGEVLGGFLPLNKNAKPGRHAQYVMEKGITQANTNSAYPEFTLDGMTNDLYTPENVKKSEDWFLEQMGVR
jgi:ABC-type Fe3+ transport system substrate-binding protein